MSISLKLIRDHLDKAGLKYDIDEDKKMAYLSIVAEDNELGKVKSPVFITLQENGEFIQFRAYPDHDFLKKEAIKNSAYLPALLQHLLYLNYTRKIGRWCFDPDDGDIYLDHGLPVEDNGEVTFKQFERLRTALVRSMFEATPDLKRIIETGTALKLDADQIILEAINMAIGQKKMDLVPALAVMNKSADQKTLILLQYAIKNNDIVALEQAVSS